MLAVAMGFGQETEKPDPISDRLRYEIAVAQRDYFLAQLQADRAAAQVRSKIEAAQKACAGVEKTFSVETFACR